MKANSKIMVAALVLLLISMVVAGQENRPGDNSKKRPSSDSGGGVQNVKDDIEEILQHYHNIIFGFGTLLGFVLNFVGYKLFPVTMFLAGSVAAGTASYILVDQTIAAASNKTYILIGVSAVTALIGGILACKLRRLGIFLVGASAGVVGAIAVNDSVLIPNSVPIAYFCVVASIFGITTGILAFKLERFIIILATSLTGSVAAIMGVKYFVELSGEVPVVTWSSSLVWIYVGCFIGFFIAGLLVQFSSTSKKKNRRKSLLANAFHPEVVNIETKGSIIYAVPGKSNDEGTPTTTTKHFINLV